MSEEQRILMIKQIKQALDAAGEDITDNELMDMLEIAKNGVRRKIERIFKRVREMVGAAFGEDKK